MTLYLAQHLEIIKNPWKSQICPPGIEEPGSYCRNKEINEWNVSKENLSLLSYHAKQSI
jgi:hypothetical protein